MPDDLDRASEYEQLMLSAQLQAHNDQVKKQPVVQSTGYCLCCGEPLPDGRRWCDADCRDDWERQHG